MVVETLVVQAFLQSIVAFLFVKSWFFFIYCYICRWNKPKKEETTMNNDRLIRFDWAMKRMLCDKANFAVLEGLVTVLLGEPITIIELLESESNQLTEDDKFNRVDIKAKDSKGEIIIVEVQNTREIYYLERILYGASKAVTEHISLGRSYQEVKKVISISIVYFDLGKGSDYLYHGYTHFEGVHTHDELQITTKQRDAVVKKMPKEVFPEYYLIRVNEFNKVASTPLEEWVSYLKTGEIEPQTTAPGLQEVRSRLRYYDMTPSEKYAYDEHINAMMIQNDVLANARDEGWAGGLEKGKAMEKRSNAQNLKKAGVPVDVIATALGISVDEVNNL